MADDVSENRPVRMRFRFTEAEANSLGEIARAEGISLAALVRQWIANAITARQGVTRKGNDHDNQPAHRK
jgi:hypothetical protein